MFSLNDNIFVYEIEEQQNKFQTFDKPFCNVNIALKMIFVPIQRFK